MFSSCNSLCHTLFRNYVLRHKLVNCPTSVITFGLILYYTHFANDTSSYLHAVRWIDLYISLYVIRSIDVCMYRSVCLYIYQCSCRVCNLLLYLHIYLLQGTTAQGRATSSDGGRTHEFEERVRAIDICWRSAQGSLRSVRLRRRGDDEESSSLIA